MKLKTKDFGKACTIIKDALDTKNVSLITETLSVVASGMTLTLSVTNREYFCSTKFALDEPSELKAAVNAQLFLNLISKLTTETIELSVDGKSLKVVGNGRYTIPMIFNGESLVELPEITINNVTDTMTIPAATLQSILTHNSKELQRGEAVRPVQSYYYIDNHGCLTFTSGACVNNFTLEKDIKLLLSDKIVKLFKLFKSAENVSFTLGQDPLTDEITQTKVMFKTDNITLTSIMTDSSLISSVPVSAIRNMATNDCTYTISVNKSKLLDTLGRLRLFTDDKNYGKFEFSDKYIVITDWSGANVETVELDGECEALRNQHYNAVFNIDGLYLIVDDPDASDTITMCFGDHRAIIIRKNSVSDILPEARPTA